MGKIVGFGFLVIALCGIGFLGVALGFRSDCVKAEAGIRAQYEQDKNNYDNYWKKIKEMAQVPDAYTTDLKKVYDGAMQGRYGANGSQAMFQFIKEHNPNFDSSLYTKLQAAIEAGRDSFSADQKQLIDRKREYETLLNGNTALVANLLFNFPHIDLDKFGIVTSDETDDAFNKKKVGEIKLR